MKAYCIFCKTGFEYSVAQDINKIFNNFEAVVPTKVLKEKRNGKWEDKNQILLPGYIFLFGEQKLEETLRDKVFNVYKLLQYKTGERALTGSDYEYAMWVYRHNGSIVTSEVIAEGKNVKVIDGPLLDITGKIVRLDKHKKRAWVEIDFDGQKRVISLSVECILELKDNAIS